jgi:hypothetical protein
MDTSAGLRIPQERLIDGRMAFFTFTTPGYTRFVANLHASLVKFDPTLASKLIVFCSDAATATTLNASGVFTIECATSGLPEFTLLRTDNDGFARVVNHKFSLARKLLREVEYVWWCDGDIVVRAPILERLRPMIEGGEYDLIMQQEWPKAVVNTGFWLARKSPAVDSMLARMEKRTARDGDDQAVFNRLEATRPDLRIGRLGYDEFLCGNRFYYRYFSRPPRCRIMHFNYSEGQETKLDLMVGHRCWHLPEPRITRAFARMRHMRIVLLRRAPALENPVNRTAGFIDRALRRAGLAPR